MYTLTINGFKTKKQAEEFAKWYESQGEQDISYWLELNEKTGCNNMDFDLNSYPLKWKGNNLNITIIPQ